VCTCDTNWNGDATCGECTPGFSGLDCATIASVGILKTIVFIVVGVVVVILLVVGGWFLKRRYDARVVAALTDDIMMGLGMCFN
jgi:hypothetical protein